MKIVDAYTITKISEIRFSCILVLEKKEEGGEGEESGGEGEGEGQQGRREHGGKEIERGEGGT